MTNLEDRQKLQGKRLKQLRKQLGISANRLAHQLNEQGASVSRGAIANWECGKNGIASNKLPILAAVLNTTESYLLTGQGEPNATNTVNTTKNVQVTKKSLPFNHHTDIQANSMSQANQMNRPLKNPINLPMSVMTFVASCCRQPIVWKQKDKGSLN